MDQVLGPFGEPSAGDILHERNPRLRLEQIGQIGRVQTADCGKTPSVKPGIKIFLNEVQQFDKTVQIFSRPVRLFIQKRREKQVQRGLVRRRSPGARRASSSAQESVRRRNSFS